ncbi:MAG: HTTM domain-containing protein [Vulcanimicrobiota bacterium]
MTLDLRSLAAWRIGLAGLVLLDIALRLRDLQAFYGDAGLLSRPSVFAQTWLSPVYCLFLSSGDTAGLLFLFAAWATAAVCMLVGYQTRLACFVTWYFVVSIQLRNPMVMDGGDDFLRVLLFWTFFLPLGARWSMDARGKDWSKLSPKFRSLATVGVYLQFFLLYFFAALLKTGEDWRKTGEALYYTLSIDQFTTNLGLSLLSYPEVLRYLTWAALGLEFLLPILLLVPVRFTWVRGSFLLLAVSFHLGIALMLHLGIFMLIMIVSLVVFVPGAWWDRRWPEEPTAEVEELPPGYRLNTPTRVFAGLILAYMVYVNIYSIGHVQKLPTWAHVVARYTYQHQHWHFFAPFPFREDGYFQLLVETDQGVRDILQRGPVDESGRPHLGSSRFPNQRWRRWMQNLIQIEIQDTPNWRSDTLVYLLEKWKKSHPHIETKSARLIFVKELSQPPGLPVVPEPVVLAEQP